MEATMDFFVIRKTCIGFNGPVNDTEVWLLMANQGFYPTNLKALYEQIELIFFRK